VKKKTLITASIISALLFTAVAGTQFVNVGKSNPYLRNPYATPPADIEPQIITILSPQNNTSYASRNLSLSFKVSINSANNRYHMYINTIVFNESWQKIKLISVYEWSWNNGWNPSDDDPKLTEFLYERNLTNIPEGKQNITVVAYARGYYIQGLFLNGFDTNVTSSVIFTIDTIPPVVSVLGLDNTTFVEQEIALNFTVNEPCSKVSYVLDQKENVTVAGNVTLAGLSYGVHNVTIYAWDVAGNSATSETRTFTVTEPEPEPQPKPFLTTMVIAPIASIAVLGVGLAAYFKRRKHQTETVEL
jgi:hypothetical protein